MGYKDPDKQREYQRNWRANRRKKWFADKICAWCGATENLVLHHLNPNEKEDHKIWSWSWERILKEVSKCIVVCEEEHQHYHNGYAKHGSNSMYLRYKCRCQICRDAHAKVNRESRHRTLRG